MDRERFWLNPNDSVAQGHPKINQLRNQDNDGVNVNLIKKRQVSYDSDKMILLLAKSLNFKKEKKCTLN